MGKLSLGELDSIINRKREEQAEVPEAAAPYIADIDAAADRYGVPREYARRLVQTESNFNPNAVSPAGAQGLMQIVPKWHPNVDPFNPKEAIDYGIRYFRENADRFGRDGQPDWRAGAAAYNAGPGTVERRGMDNLPAETRAYVPKVVGEGQQAIPQKKPRLSFEDIDSIINPKEPDGYLKTAAKGFTRGAESIAEGVGSMIEWGGEVAGSETIADIGRNARKYWQEAQQKGWAAPDEAVFGGGDFFDNPSIKRAVGLIAQAVPWLGASLATGGGAAAALTKAGVSAARAALLGGAVGGAALGTAEGAQDYIGAREAGKSVGEASKVGALSSIGTAVLEALPTAKFLRGLKGGIGTRILKGAATEGITEGAQTGWQNLVAKIGYEPTRQLAEGLVDSIIGGAGVGGMAGTVFKHDADADDTIKKANEKINQARAAGATEEDITQARDAIAKDIEKVAEDVAPEAIEEEIEKPVEATMKDWEDSTRQTGLGDDEVAKEIISKVAYGPIEEKPSEAKRVGELKTILERGVERGKRELKIPEPLKRGDIPGTEVDVGAQAREIARRKNAEALRSDTGRLYQEGDTGPEGEGREDIQRDTQEVAEAGGAEVSREEVGPLRYDPSVDQHNGEKLTRGDVLTDEEGNRYALDRDSGFMLTLTEIDEDGKPKGIKSFSVDPTDTDRFKNLYKVGENIYEAPPEGATAPEVALEAPVDQTGNATKQSNTILESLSKAQAAQTEHEKAFAELESRLPNGTVINGWKKTDIGGETFWEKGGEGLPFIYKEVGGKAVAKALGLPEDAGFNPTEYTKPKEPGEPQAPLSGTGEAQKQAYLTMSYLRQRVGDGEIIPDEEIAVLEKTQPEMADFAKLANKFNENLKASQAAKEQEKTGLEEIKKSTNELRRHFNIYPETNESGEIAKSDEEIFQSKVNRWVEGKTEKPDMVYGLANGKPISGKNLSKKGADGYRKNAQKLANYYDAPVAFVTIRNVAGIPQNGYFLRLPYSFKGRAKRVGASDEIVLEGIIGSPSSGGKNILEYIVYPKEKKAKPQPANVPETDFGNKGQGAEKVGEEGKEQPAFKRGTEAPGLPKQEVVSITEKISKNWKGAPDFAVHSTQKTLPDPVQAMMGDGDVVKGVLYDGVVHLVAPNLATEQDVVEAIFHEAFGHYGLKALGERGRMFAYQVYGAKKTAIADILKEPGYGFDVSTREGKIQAADEWLAREAQNNPESTWVDRAIRLVKGFIRKLGFDVKLSDAEIRAWIADMRHVVVEGKAQAVRWGDARFSKAEQEANPDIRFMRGKGEGWFEETKRPVTQEDYEANRKIKKDVKGNITRTIRQFKDEIKEGTDRYLGVISTRLGNINEGLKSKIRKLDFDINKSVAQDIADVEPLLRKASKMTATDKADWDYARKNSDKAKIDELVAKYGMEKEHAKYREVLDQIKRDAYEVGLTLGTIEEYAPRILKDPKGFLRAIGKEEDWPILSRLIDERAAAMGITSADMTLDQKANIVSSAILGVPMGLGGPSATKERKLKKIPPYLNQYYMDSDAALMHHIREMRNAIESRRFFGKIPEKVARIRTRMNEAEARIRELNKIVNDENLSQEERDEARKKRSRAIGRKKQYEAYLTKYAENRNYQDNIASYIVQLIANGEISAKDEKTVQEILNARFHERGSSGIVQAYKNFSYIDTMGSPISALTQIGDLAWAAYEGSFDKTLKHAYRAATGKSKITKEDVGIDRIAQEFADASTLSKALNLTFKYVGLEKIDSIGKEALLNSALEKYQAQARKNPIKLKSDIRKIFGNETDDVVQDLIDGEITDNVKLLVYNKLADFQPIALSEMPQKYLEAGNGRVFYMLKTFTLKQFDAFRRESYNKIKNGNREEKIQGMKNLVRLAMLFTLANAGADELKDWILGRKTDMEDRVVDNVLRLFGVSKFVTWKARTEGVGSSLARQILPPFKFVDAAGKDIMSAGDEKGLELTASIPIVGKLYYWHMGRGVHKREDLWNRRLSKRKAKIQDVVEQYEKADNKREFFNKHRKELLESKRIGKFQSHLNKLKARANKLRKIEKQTPQIEGAIKRLENERIRLIKEYLDRVQ